MDFEHWKVNWFKKRDNEPYIEIHFLSYIYILLILNLVHTQKEKLNYSLYTQMFIKKSLLVAGIISS